MDAEEVAVEPQRPLRGIACSHCGDEAMHTPTHGERRVVKVLVSSPGRAACAECWRELRCGRLYNFTAGRPSGCARRAAPHDEPSPGWEDAVRAIEDAGGES